MTSPRYTYRRYLDDTWADAVDRREGGGRARDPWCVSALLRLGQISPGQHGAAVKFCSLVERSFGQGKAGGLSEFVDGKNFDPHAAMFDRVHSNGDAAEAWTYVSLNMPAPTEKRLKVFVAALKHPHRNVSQAQQESEMGYGGKARDLFVGHLQAGLEVLMTYFDAVDAQAQRARKNVA